MSLDQKPRLLIIGPLPPPYAGPEIGTEMFAGSEALRSAFELRVINTTVRASNRDKGKTDLTMVLAFVRYLWQLLGAVLFWQPQFVLYRPTSATVKGWVRDGTTILIGSIARSRVVLQFGGGHFVFFYDSLGTVGKSLIRRLLSRTSAVLAESNSLRRQFLGLLSEEKIGVLPTAVSLDFFAHFDDVDRRARPPPLIVLFVGHLSQAKGYCDLLKVVPDLVAQFDVQFQFMGAAVNEERNIFFNQATGERIQHEDPRECFARYISRNKIEDRVVFLGDQVFGDNKLAVFERASVFVMPSYSEGFSRAFLEAMAAGLPAVVTRVGAVPDIVHDADQAFVIAPGDVPALRDRLATLLGDAELRVAMGKASRQTCRQRFLDEAVARDLVNVLHGLGRSSKPNSD